MYRGTKRQIGQYVQEYLSRWSINADQPVDIRDVYAELDRVTNKYARLGLFQNMTLGDRNVQDNYLTTFTGVPIGFDKDQEICYSVLPAKFIALPHGRGIDAVFPEGGRDRELYPLPRHFRSSFRFSPASVLSGNNGFWCEGEKIYYTKKYDVSGVEKMVIRLVIASAASIDEDAPYPIDPGMESTVLDEVIAHFLGSERKPQDKVADNRQTDQ